MTKVTRAHDVLTVGTKPSAPRGARGFVHSAYPLWGYLPAAVVYLVFFALPAFASFYFSLTRWTLFDVEFIGLDNFRAFFTQPRLYSALTHTLIYGFITSGAKVVLGLGLGVFLTSQVIGRNFLRSVIFFPTLISTIGIGITFSAILDPYDGLLNRTLAGIGVNGPAWLTDPQLALFTVAGIDVWKGLGIASLIYVAGLVAIPREFYEAARVDGAGGWKQFWTITWPLVRPASVTVIILSLTSGLRSFDLIWATTGGGPGFASDVIASVIYKQYQAGFYGLSTAGNVVLFIVVIAVMAPVQLLLYRRETER